jgi:hypothetical protein
MGGNCRSNGSGTPRRYVRTDVPLTEGRRDLPAFAYRFTDEEIRRLDAWLALMDAKALAAARLVALSRR